MQSAKGTFMTINGQGHLLTLVIGPLEPVV